MDDVPAPCRAEDIDTRHVGVFVHARCGACGWQGPARRALASATADAGRHVDLVVDLRDPRDPKDVDLRALAAEVVRESSAARAPESSDPAPV